mgnify:CR=1 FL=1
MAKFCGGINLGTGLKVLNGVICDDGATSVNVANAVTGCGQLWDGALFTKAFVDGAPVITLHNSEGGEVGTPVKVRGNCGVGLDGRFFKVIDGVVTLQDGFLLTVNATPTDATIKVTDADSTEISPVTGKTNVFLLSELGDQYTVTVSKTGYTTQTKTVSNNGDQTITVTLVSAG